jgi:NAD(P)-dependent dehydrogenase (short-subunit alcohol dehydrogenase family)
MNMKRRRWSWLPLAASGTFALGAYLMRKAATISLHHKVVVITGGSRGLGLALAREFGRQGARLALLARHADELDRVRDELSVAGVEVLTLVCDVRDSTAVQHSIEQIIAHYGQLDVLINAAGVIQVSPFEHATVSDFEEAMAIHFWGPLTTSLHAIRQMRCQGGGRIVNIASIGGKVATPHLLPYSASKFALVGLSDGMRAELSRHNIKVTTVCPGLMRTGSHINAQFKGQHKREFSWFSVANALPIFSTSAASAARQIVAACRHGAPQLIITPQARLLTLAQALFPDVVAFAMDITSRLLPKPTSNRGNALQPGWQSRSRWSPSPLTTLADHSTERYNEAQTPDRQPGSTSG